LELWYTSDCAVIDNDSSGLFPTYDDNTDNSHLFVFGGSNHVVTGNVWGPMPQTSTLAAVVLCDGCSTSTLLDNDYTMTSTFRPLDRPACVIATHDTSDNFVFETARLPPGGPEKHLLDIQGLKPPEGLGMTSNRFVGLSMVARESQTDANPGVGQRVQEAVDRTFRSMIETQGAADKGTIHLIRAFVRVGNLMKHNRELVETLSALKSRLASGFRKCDEQFRIVREAIRELMESPQPSEAARTLPANS
jgi:hypothetical protein